MGERSCSIAPPVSCAVVLTRAFLICKKNVVGEAKLLRGSFADCSPRGGGWGAAAAPQAAICAGAAALRRPGYEICWTFTAFIFTTIRPVQQKKESRPFESSGKQA